MTTTDQSPANAPVGAPTASDVDRAMRACDGVICFGGEDWWYHNRGHVDMQLMREFSRDVPVLYVNSIGMRVPRIGEGSMFLTRVRRKLRSLRRGLVSVRPNFSVLSPISAPGRIGTAISRRVMPGQVLRAARSMGIRRPLLWVACPPGAQAIDAIDPVALVYQRTDRFEAFPNVDREAIGAWCDRMRDEADLTMFCSRLLHEEEGDACRNAVYVDHGVDFDRFAEAGADPSSEPDDVRELPRPRAGFVGGIDSHTFDPPLFERVVELLPDVTFVMVGASSLPEDWCRKPNVRFLGQRPYEEVAGYMASCDVLLMPWNRSEWIKACNPIKMKEYLATGRPVVTTSFDELAHWEGYMRVADGAEAFAAAIRTALEEPIDVERQRARVRRETWTAKAAVVRDALRAAGVRLGLDPESPAA